MTRKRMRPLGVQPKPPLNSPPRETRNPKPETRNPKPETRSRVRDRLVSDSLNQNSRPRSSPTPAELVIYLWRAPPAWLLDGWTRLLVLILGLAIIFLSLRFNVWSKKQQVIDDLAEEISWAIQNLVNRNPRPTTNQEVAQWEADFRSWYKRVSGKLEDRAFFTRADQLHFDMLGFVEPIGMTGIPRLDWLLSQLKLKFDRLRDVINWAQERTR